MRDKLKQTAFLALAAIILLSFAACSSGGLSADELAFKMLNLYTSLPPCSQYIKNAEEYSSGYISPEDFAFLYSGERQALPEWNLIDEFRIIMSDSTEFFEIHIIKTFSSSAADEIAKLLNRRAKLLRLYQKAEYDYPAKHPEVFISGRFVILIATSDNESALRLLKKLL